MTNETNAAARNRIFCDQQKFCGGESPWGRYSTAMFANLTGYNQSTISRIENGKQVVAPSFNILVRSLAANKLPDRDYDLHDKWINHKGYMAKTIEIVSGKKGWSIKKAA